MNSRDLFDELSEIAKNIGITIRKEKGNFKSGICLIKDKEIVILNKTTPVEAMNSILAACLFRHSENIFMKPIIRDFIEKENNGNNPEQFYLEIDELLTVKKSKTGKEK